MSSPVYRGTIRFTSTDPAAVLPANYTFTAADAGTHTFTGGVTLKTAGSRTVMATDIADSGISGSQTITVNAAAADHLDVTGIANPAIVNVASNVVITARDAFNNVASSYRGIIHFTSTDPAAILPANYIFTAADAGTHTFAGGVTFKTAGSRTVTATDTVTATITGSQTVTVNPAMGYFSVTGITNPATAGVASNVTVTARDTAGNVMTGYRGTIHFTSTDPLAVLPSNYTFTAADAGAHTFTNGVNLKTAGSRTVTVNDVVTTSIVGSQTVMVEPAVATHLDVTSIPNPATAGAAYDVVVAARDQFNNVATGYRGTIQFTSSDPAAILPANYTFTALDAGTNTFTDGVILKTPGSRWVKAMDMAHASITGMQTVIVKPGALHHFTVSAPKQPRWPGSHSQPR